MLEILTVGEILVEVMREKIGVGLGKADTFRGPFASGAPAIFIDTVANLGHGAAMVGGVGDDDFGRLCLNRLKDDGVLTEWIKISELATGVAFVAYFKDGSRKFLYHIRNSAASDIGTVPDKKLKDIKIFHIMGCSLMIRKEIAEKIIDYATSIKKYGGKISFDPNIRTELLNKDYIRNAVEMITGLSDIVIPGPEELLLITGQKNKESAVSKILKKGRILVLKQGKKGCEIYSPEKKESIFIPSFKIEQVDPTGAGDSFDAGFLCAYLESMDLYQCGVLANACGALNSTKFGPMEGVFRREIVDDFIANNN